MKRCFGLLLAGFLVFSALDAGAQQPPQPVQPAQPPQAPAAPSQPSPARGVARAAPAVPVVPATIDDIAGGQPVNIRLEVTIVDQAASGQPVRRVINILAADRSFARIRSLFTDAPESAAAGAPRSPDNRRVDVDARPRIVGSSIRVDLTIQNNALGSGNPLLNWTQSFTVFLENAKVATPIESTDPSTNRKMSIEVKATILK